MAIQRETLKIVEGGFKAGTVNELDVAQARSTLEQTEADIPALETAARLVNNQLCILLGIPPEDLHAKIGAGPIPKAPAEVAAGIPADLLRRRPDVRRAADWVADQFRNLGLHTELVETEGHPIVLAESPPVADAPVVLVYGHYDVQPPDPLDQWTTPPFEPTKRDGNVTCPGRLLRP